MTRIFRFLLRPHFSPAELLSYVVTYQVSRLHGVAAALIVLSAWIVVQAVVTATLRRGGHGLDD